VEIKRQYNEINVLSRNISANKYFQEQKQEHTSSSSQEGLRNMIMKRQERRKNDQMNANSTHKILPTLLNIKIVNHKRKTDVKENLNVRVITGEADDYEMRCL
jgi:hypothetical protein